MDRLNQHGAIRIGYLDNCSPFCTASGSGDLTGVLNDYLTLAAKCTKNVTLDFDTRAYPTLSDAFTALNAGEIDCVFPVCLSPFDAEQMNVMVTSPFVQTEMYLLMRKDSQSTISADSNMVVAINETNSNEITFLKDHFPNSRIVKCTSVEACVNAVESSDADCLIISNYQVTQPQFDNYDLYPLTTGETMDFAFAVRKSDHAL